MILYYTNWCQQILQYIFNIVLTRAQPLPTWESRKPVWIQRLGVCTGTVRSPNLHVSRPSLMKCAPSNWTSGIKLNHAKVARYSKIYPSHAPWNCCLSFWCPRQRKIHRFFFCNVTNLSIHILKDLKRKNMAIIFDQNGTGNLRLTEMIYNMSQGKGRSSFKHVTFSIPSF